MMLGQPDGIDPELVRQHRLAQRLVDDRAVARRIAAIGKQEIADFHGPPPSSPAIQTAMGAIKEGAGGTG